jgi:dimethylaniline monooxygenase (N-oxide forming)
MSAFSDFLMPEEYPNFLPHGLVKEYLKSYAGHFDLMKHVSFNATVEKVSSSGGKWHVVWKNKDGIQERKRFDAVIVCTGKQTKPKMPIFEGTDEFKGEILHTNAFEDSAQYAGKRVVVVGMGASGMDTAVDICQHASQVRSITTLLNI